MSYLINLKLTVHIELRDHAKANSNTLLLKQIQNLVTFSSTERISKSMLQDKQRYIRYREPSPWENCGKRKQQK